jgi:hypothetical protein
VQSLPVTIALKLCTWHKGKTDGSGINPQALAYIYLFLKPGCIDLYAGEVAIDFILDAPAGGGY